MWSRRPVVSGRGGPLPWVGSSTIERRCPSTAVGQQLADLPRVQEAGPPVEADAPDRERPPEDLRQGGKGAGPVAEQQQRERVEQVRGGRLAEEVDRQRAEPTGPQEGHQAPQE